VEQVTGQKEKKKKKRKYYLFK